MKGHQVIGLQQVVPDIRPREIEVTSNTFQDLRPQQKLVSNAMKCDFSWDKSAEKYLDVYKKIIGR